MDALEYAIQKELMEWDPLPESKKKRISDLDNYKTESIDISFILNFANNEKNAIEQIVDVLNQAFEINLTFIESKPYASKIWKIFQEYSGK